MTIHNQCGVPLTLRFMLPLVSTACLRIAIFPDDQHGYHLSAQLAALCQEISCRYAGARSHPRQQLFLLRISMRCRRILLLSSAVFCAIDFIMMFFSITGAIWLGGAGSCIVFGLYWKRGTAAGAWSSLIAGSTIATTGFVVQHSWVGHIYPWLQRHDLLEAVSRFFASASAPFEPFIVWRVTEMSFPMNSQEIYFLALVVSITLYVVVSLLSGKEAFNMDRMLHRGKYHVEGKEVPKTALTFQTAWNQ
jgi:Na+/proline symporter